MTRVIERRPASRVAARRDHDTRRAHRGGDVREARVVADDEPRLRDERGERAERRAPGEVDRRARLRRVSRVRSAALPPRCR